MIRPHPSVYRPLFRLIFKKNSLILEKSGVVHRRLLVLLFMCTYLPPKRVSSNFPKWRPPIITMDNRHSARPILVHLSSWTGSSRMTAYNNKEKKNNDDNNNNNGSPVTQREHSRINRSYQWSVCQVMLVFSWLCIL